MGVLPQQPWVHLTSGPRRTILTTTSLYTWGSDEHFIALVNDRYFALFEALPALLAVCQDIHEAGALTPEIAVALEAVLAATEAEPPWFAQEEQAT